MLAVCLFYFLQLRNLPFVVSLCKGCILKHLWRKLFRSAELGVTHVVCTQSRAGATSAVTVQTKRALTCVANAMTEVYTSLAASISSILQVHFSPAGAITCNVAFVSSRQWCFCHNLYSQAIQIFNDNVPTLIDFI